MDHNAVDDENDNYERDDTNVLINDFFEDTMLDAGYDGEDVLNLIK